MRTKKKIPMIPIGEEYRISWDGLNVTLSQKCRPRRAGTDGSWRGIGYYSTFQNALEGLVDHAVIQTDLEDLKAVVEKQGELHQLIKGLKTPQGFGLELPPESLYSPQKRRTPPAGIKPFGKKKRGLKSCKSRKDIVSKGTVAGLLNGGDGKGKRGRGKGG